MPLLFPFIAMSNENEESPIADTDKIDTVVRLKEGGAYYGLVVAKPLSGDENSQNRLLTIFKISTRKSHWPFPEDLPSRIQGQGYMFEFTLTPTPSYLSCLNDVGSGSKEIILHSKWTLIFGAARRHLTRDKHLYIYRQ